MGLFGKAKKNDEAESIFKDIKVGKEVSFGRQMNNNLWIEWKVVDKQDGKYLLHSKHAFVEQRLHDVGDTVIHGKEKELTWENSAFRKWLNSSFLKKTFSSEERKHIVYSTIKTAGIETKDYLFLPSIEDAEKYYKTDEERKITDINNGYTMVEWVTRSPAEYYRWRYVNYEGKFDIVRGVAGRDIRGGIHFRVALWVEA